MNYHKDNILFAILLTIILSILGFYVCPKIKEKAADFDKNIKTITPYWFYDHK